MGTVPQYREVERKYLIGETGLSDLPVSLTEAEPQALEQFYLNQHGEPYELRLRMVEQNDDKTYLATVKKGSPPDRLEMETKVTAETYQYWISSRQTEVIRKTRQTLALAAGHWALDKFTDINMVLLEAEGNVPQPAFGKDVTDDIGFTNYHISRQLDSTELNFPNNSQYEEKLISIEEFAYKIEEIRKSSTEPIVIGIAGDTASGKTSLARKIAQLYGDSSVIISQDDYYLGVTKLKQLHGDEYEVNFDDPAALNLGLLAEHIVKLKNDETVLRPTYSMEIADPTGELQQIEPKNTPVIFIEGIHALDSSLAILYDFGIFMNASTATRIGRRLERDLADGRMFKPEDNLRYLLEIAEPTYKPYAEAQKKRADAIICT